MTDKELADILDDITIICDTREQKNQHILEYLKEIDVPYKVEKLDSADYSFILPNYPELNLDKTILIEKKNSLDEIAGNYTKGRDRFKREFERIDENQKIHLVIEQATWKKLLKGSYRSQFNPKSLMASILSTNIRYDCPVWFVGKDESPTLIYNILYYELREIIKNL